MFNFEIPCIHTRSPYPLSLPLCTTNFFRNRPLYETQRIADGDPRKSS